MMFLLMVDSMMLWRLRINGNFAICRWGFCDQNSMKTAQQKSADTLSWSYNGSEEGWWRALGAILPPGVHHLLNVLKTSVQDSRNFMADFATGEYMSQSLGSLVRQIFLD